jgi:hypothetical protein
MKSFQSKILVSAVLLCFFSACVSQRYISPQEITPEIQKNKILIQKKDGSLIEMRSPTIVGDRIVGIVDGEPKIEVPFASIQSVQVIKKSYTYPILLAGVLGVAAFLFIGMETAPSPPPSESCPFVYSFDGHHWVLEAEPYGGAFCQALERAEWIPLDRIKDVDGRYRILISNELNEAQYTDELKLVVVDHQKGVEIEADAAGKMHALAAPEPPLRAFDGQGNDVLAEIAATDHLFWQSPLTGLAAFPQDGRDELVLEFSKPMGALQAKLQINAWTTPWGAAAAGDFLALYGDGLRDFYADINRFGPAYHRVTSWFMDEELYLLKMLVETRDGWKAKGLIYGGGPYIAKNKAYAFDISDVPGEILRIKLRPPRNFWMFNSLAVDYSPDSQVRITELAAEKAKAPGQAAPSRLHADDNSYLILNRKGESVELTFCPPPGEKDSDRTVFLKAKGYYDIHLDAGGEPRWDVIDRVYNEPGFSVRLANERYWMMIHNARQAPHPPK